MASLTKNGYSIEELLGENAEITVQNMAMWSVFCQYIAQAVDWQGLDTVYEPEYREIEKRSGEVKMRGTFSIDFWTTSED